VSSACRVALLIVVAREQKADTPLPRPRASECDEYACPRTGELMLEKCCSFVPSLAARAVLGLLARPFVGQSPLNDVVSAPLSADPPPLLQASTTPVFLPLRKLRFI
jgi:hypothetical protein